MAQSLLIVSEFYPNENHPHAGLFVQQQLSYLPGEWQKTVLVPEIRYLPLPRYRELRRMQAQTGMRREGDVTVFRFPLMTVPKLDAAVTPAQFLRQARRAIAQSGQSFDLIHAHWAYRSGYVASKLAASLNLPFVLTLHGSDLNLWLHERGKKQKSLRALHAADALIVLSERMRVLLDPYGLPEDKIFVVPQGLDLEKFAPRDSEVILQKRASVRAEFVFICVANFYPGKGHAILLQALSRLPAEVGLILLGDGPLRPVWERTAADEVAAGRVHFAGQVRHDEIPDWLNAADALVLPSLREGLPTVILEALACGLPVVATDVGGVRDVIDGNGAGRVVPPGSPQLLAEEMLEVMKKPVDSREIRQKVVRFAWEAFTRSLARAYAFARSRHAEMAR